MAGDFLLLYCGFQESRSKGPTPISDVAQGYRLRDDFDELKVDVRGPDGHVDNDCHSRRGRAVPARHDCHDRGTEGAGGIRPAHCPRQGGGHAALGCLLGHDRHAARAVIKRRDDDDDQPRQRRTSDLSAGARPRVQRQCRYDGNGWLVALIGVRISLSAYALPMIFVGAPVKLLAGGRMLRLVVRAQASRWYSMG